MLLKHYLKPRRRTKYTSPSGKLTDHPKEQKKEMICRSISGTKIEAGRCVPVNLWEKWRKKTGRKE